MDKPSDLALLAVYQLAGFTDWEGFRSTYMRKPTLPSANGIDIKFVEYIGDDRDPDTYGDYSNGSVGTHSLIFEVTGNDDVKTFIRKDGRVDSYGDASWEGPIYEVKIVTKSVNAYERI